MKRLKKRYIFFIVSCVILAVVSSVGMVRLGHTYSLMFFGGELSPNPSGIKTTIDDESVVKVKNISKQKLAEVSPAFIEFEAVGSGETNVKIEYKGKIESEEKYSVDSLGIIRIGDNPFTARSNSFKAFFPTLIIFIAILVITLSVGFFERIRNGDFSYPLIARGGIIVYLTGNIATLLISFFLENNNDAIFSATSYLYTTMSDILDLVASGGMRFAIIMFPVAFIFAIALSISNISLIIHEGFRPVNLLGIALGMFIMFGFIGISGIVSITPIETIESNININIIAAVNVALEYAFVYLECLLFSTIVCSFMAARYKVKPEQDYIIILGCAIRKDGTPTPILRGRIDRALEFEREQFEKTGKHAKFVPSGGQGGNEVISEAESMRRYLVSQGIPEQQIIPEGKSVSTFENMKFSKNKIEEDCKDLSKVNIAFSTTNYHVFRGYTLADSLKMKVKGLSAKTKLYFFPNAFVREFIGLLFEEKVKHLIFMALIILLFVTMVIVM
ncbi:MAG: ElyC/SanA/YdcF family protein [Ruminococcus sp.]|nr:ElyC/SanA/YdcF family protein [Ruminococcus sp.]